MSHGRWTFLVALGLVAVAACQSQAPPAQPAAGAPSPDLTPVGTIKDVMEGLVDPAADVIFESVVFSITYKGEEQKMPRNDEEWAQVEHNALLLAEAANLLKMEGRPVAAPGDVTTSGADSPELPPDQIQARIDKDRAMWIAHANKLQEVAVRTLAIARKQDVQGILDIGGDIDQVCENCHLAYWYPPKQ